jgi:hypothetical protein
MAKSGSKITPNFVPTLWISQLRTNRGYSQCIGIRLIFGFCQGYLQKAHNTQTPTYCIPPNLTQTHNYDIPIAPSFLTSTSFKLLNH